MLTKYYDGSERRVHIRYGSSIPVRFRLVGEEPGEWGDAEARNISNGGIMLAVRDGREELLKRVDVSEKRPNVELEVALRTPEGSAVCDPMRAECTVRWLKKPALLRRELLLGLRFDELSDEEKTTLREYIVATFVQKYPDYRKG